MNAKAILRIAAPFLIGAAIGAAIVFLVFVLSLRSSNAKLAADNVKLEQSNKNLATQLASSGQLIDNLNKQIAGAGNTISRLEQILGDSKRTIESLSGQLADAKGTIDQLRKYGGAIASGQHTITDLAIEAQGLIRSAISIATGTAKESSIGNP